jgi:hypothetical protein
LSFSGWLIVLALLAASLRAALLFRASTKVEAVNAVVITTLASGRGRELSDVLSKSGSGLYLTVARSISLPLDKLLVSDERELRERLERDAQIGFITATRALRRFAWLDAAALVAMLLAGASAVTGSPPSAMLGLGLVAATLLWLSNLYRARSIATRMFAAGMALVDGLVAGREQIRTAGAEPQR